MSPSGLPDPNQIADPATRAWARAVTERLNTALGHTGAFKDRMPTWDALREIGVIGLDDDRPESPYRKPLTAADPINRASVSPAAPASQVTASAVFDATAGKAVGAHTLSISLPLGAYVTFGWIEVQIPLASATNAATVAIGIAVEDLVALLNATQAGTAAWTAGTHPTKQTGSAANFTPRTTDVRSLIVTVAAEALTAGKFTLFVYYSI